MKTKEEIQQQLIEEQMQVDAFQDMQPETIADAIVKEKGIAMHKAKVSLLEWILEDDIQEIEDPIDHTGNDLMGG